MSDSAPPGWIYNETVRMFATPGNPPFEDSSELEKYWGRVWGVDNDVGRIRSILMHRPGDEMKVVDPSKRIESIGSFGDLEKGWYFQCDTVPPLAAMQAQHDALVAALRAQGVEIHFVEGVGGGRLKSCYTRDPFIMVKGGAIVTPHGDPHPPRRGTGDHPHAGEDRRADPAHTLGQRGDGRRQLRLDQSQRPASSAAASGSTARAPSRWARC